MKKLLSIILCLILCFSLVSCKSENSASSQSTKSTDSTKSSSIEEQKNDSLPIVTPNIDINKLYSISITANSSAVEFFSSDTRLSTTCSYINGLQLKETNTPPTRTPNVIIKIIYGSKYGSNVVDDENEIKYIEAAGSKIGLSKSYNEIEKWYDMITPDGITPLEFLDGLFYMEEMPLSISNGKINFGEKELYRISIVNYLGWRQSEGYKNKLIIEDYYTIKDIISFFENIELGEPVESNELNEQNASVYLYFYFTDGTYMKIFFQYSYYLLIGKNYYDIGDSKREEWDDMIYRHQPLG